MTQISQMADSILQPAHD